MKRSINLPEGIFLVLLYLKLSHEHNYAWLVVFCPLIYDAVLSVTKIVLMRLRLNQKFIAWSANAFLKVHYFFTLRKLKRDLKVKK